MLLLSYLPAQAVVVPSLRSQHPDITEDELATMDSGDCLECHGNPDNAVTPADSGYLPDRHHLRVDTPIGPYSASPYPENSSNGKHQCITCHLIDWIPDPDMPLGGSYRFALEPVQTRSRNCLLCHLPNGVALGRNNVEEATSADINAYEASSITPVITELSETRVTADPDSPLLLLGTGFVESAADGETASSPWVRLTDYGGDFIDIYPDYVSSTQLEITIPASIAPGNYKLTVRKRDERLGTVLSSQPAVLSVIPRITVDTVHCNLNTITINGSGFSNHYLDARDSGTSVRAGKDGEECLVHSWTDDEIVATCNSGIGQRLTISTLYDSSTSSISCSLKPGPKWWSIWSWWSSWSWSRR